MKKQPTIYILFGVFFMILLGLVTLKNQVGDIFLSGFFALKNQGRDKTIDVTCTVYVKKTETGFQLFRNGKPFYIRGAAGNSHFNELANIGGNTIRVYDTINLDNILNKAHAANLAVIVDIPIPGYSKKYCTYLNEDSNRVLKQKIKSLVKKHSSHPALLMWNLGNEVRYPQVRIKRIFTNIFNNTLYKEENSFIKTFNELIDIIHREDMNHPVSSSISANVSNKTNASIYLNSPEIDLLSYNVFGHLKDLKNPISQISFIFGTRPYYISEWGSDGHWECELTSWNTPIEPTSTKKAEHIKERYKIITEIKDGAFLGSLVFFWGEKHERTNTWFSFFLDDNKSEIIIELENLWRGSRIYPTPIGLKYMLLDSKGARDNIIFAPNELKTSEIKFYDYKNDSIRIKWEIYPEDWYRNNHNKLIIPIKTEDSFKSFEKNNATFITPAKEGPYRIFAYIYDKNGYFATTNTPFYILNYCCPVKR